MVSYFERKTVKKLLMTIMMLALILFLGSDTFSMEAYAADVSEIGTPIFATAGFELTGSVKFLATDGDSIISNVQVEILNSNKEVIDTLTSGNDGKMEKLRMTIGTYYYRIVSVPDDYVLDNSEKRFDVNQATWLVKKVILLEPKVVKNYSLTTDSDLRELSYLSEEEYEAMLEGTQLAGIGDALVQAEQEYGVNGLYMMGLACQESGYGKSYYAQNRNNLVGWCAYDSNPDAAAYFESKSECILHVAEKLKENYLTEGGAYFEGYSPRAIDVHYCTDKSHADKIVSIVRDLVSDL
ncbi:MAG: glucosaminidase domain-containing protein [Clostridia bacterium]|nr:glucosaminidase domain-containing protein [Clostridia bacterium]